MASINVLIQDLRTGLPEIVAPTPAKWPLRRPKAWVAKLVFKFNPVGCQSPELAQPFVSARIFEGLRP